MKLIAVLMILASLIALWACNTAPHEAPVDIRTTTVPVAVKCAADAGPEPEYADNPAAIKGAANVFEVAKLRMRGRAQRQARLMILEAANAGCR